MLSLLPFAASALIGHLLLDLILKKRNAVDPLLRFFLGTGLGLGVSSYLVFIELLLCNQYNRIYLIVSHALLLPLLCFLWKLRFGPPKPAIPKNSRPEFLFLLVIGLAMLPIVQQALFYPMGGWDAWSAWNFKAKFIFEAGTDWKNIFNPILWRSSPHYPLLLPLIILWGWSPYSHAYAVVPQIVSLIFSCLTAGLLFSALKQKTELLQAAASVLCVFTLPFFTKLVSSQYSDIVVAYYLLSTLICLLWAKNEKNPGFALLSGLFLGFLSFSKSEGTVAAFLLGAIGSFYLLEKKPSGWKTLVLPFLKGTLGGVLPLLIFIKFLAPANQTFYNGLTSADHPSNLFRLEMIGAFSLKEFISGKWNGLWIFLLILIGLRGGKSWESPVRIIPIFLILYLGTVGFYYYLNTYFEIGWWLQVSLNRILFALLPTISLWAFYSWPNKTKATGPFK